MPIRLKVLKQKEDRIKKVAELMNMYKVPSVSVSYSYPTYEYRPIGGSSLGSKLPTVTNDPRISKTKGLFDMFHLAR
jgi:hypothetical protein